MHLSSFMAMKPFYFKDLISNSPYCLQYNSYDVGAKNFILDQLVIL